MDNVHEITEKDIAEEYAAQWLVRLDRDEEVSSVELAELKRWIDRSPLNRNAFVRMAKYWQNANILTELSVPLYSQPATTGKARMGWFKALGSRLHGSWRGAVAVGASGLAAVTIAWLVLFNINSTDVIGNGNGVYETRIGEQNTLTLQDGSVIELNTNTHIQVNFSESRRSIRLLQGEAHFSVAKNKQRPFVVQAGKGRVQAVGTAFDVRMNENLLRVIVTEGKVAVSARTNAERSNAESANAKRSEAKRSEAKTATQQSDPSPQANHLAGDSRHLGYLEAGQTLAFEPDSEANIKAAIEQIPAYQIAQQLAWRQGLLMFDGELLADVIKEVNRYTELNIQIMDEEVARLSIAGQFQVSKIDAILKVLETNFNVRVNRIDNNTVQLSKKK